MNIDQAVLGWVLGLGGAAVGVACGLLGTYASIRATQSERERAFVIRASIALWIAIAVFVTSLATIPDPYRHLLWIPYAIALPVAITYWNRVQMRIRQENARSSSTSPPTPPSGS